MLFASRMRAGCQSVGSDNASITNSARSITHKSLRIACYERHLTCCGRCVACITNNRIVIVQQNPSLKALRDIRRQTFPAALPPNPPPSTFSSCDMSWGEAEKYPEGFAQPRHRALVPTCFVVEEVVVCCSRILIFGPLLGTFFC